MATAELIAGRFRERFGVAPDAIASAPGRVNLIGEHTDYNDGFVLPMAIDRRLHVAVARRADDTTDFFMEEFGAAQTNEARRAMEYVDGVMWALRQEHPPVPGVNVLIAGGVPMGAGLASSAALEMAAARALCAVADISWHPLEAARLAQRGENERVGVQCGIMDQVASGAGRRGNAMLLDCRTLDLAYIELPAQVSIVVMDTGVRRKLADTEYNERRAACEAAVTAIRRLAPDVRALRDVTPDLLRKAEQSLEAIALRRARHVVEENARPAAMARALSAGDYTSAGELMNASHASLRDFYEVSSTHLDLICEAARAHTACYGARMTGAGFGGSAIALVRSNAVDDFVRSVPPRYEARTYKRSSFFTVRADEGARLEPF